MTKKGKDGKPTITEGKHPAKTDVTTQKAAEARTKKIVKKSLDEPYRDVLTFLETPKVSLFKNRNYQLSMFIGLSLS